MPIKHPVMHRMAGLAMGLGVAGAAAAQQPLSVIDWLSKPTQAPLPGTVLMEPPVSPSVTLPDIQVSPLAALAPPLGLVPGTVTGLPVDLWLGSDIEDLTRLMARAPVAHSPAMQTLLYSVLLSETRPPAGPDGLRLTLARIDRLMALGAVDPAQALTRRADPMSSPALFRRWFDSTLLTGDEDQACELLQSQPHLLPGYDAQIFCAARAGDWATAALTLETAHALELLPPWKLDLLDRFLSPELFEGAPPLPAPLSPDPLAFRLFEAIGERLPSRDLPRAFATADLRDVAGWKAQLEAAERLTRIGALSPNRLLGLYTERLPAASGGIWDRVEALQRFDTALTTRSPDAVQRTLAPVWAAMQQAGLEVPFAELFGDRLAQVRFTNPAAATLAWRIRLLSGTYETAAHTPPDNSAMNTFLAALAQGDPGRALAPNDTAQAIADGFGTDVPLPRDIQNALDQGQLGQAILLTIRLFHTGAGGNAEDLSQALAALRRMGLEDTARRAALQLTLLGYG